MAISVNKLKMNFKPDETVKQLLKRMNYIFPLIIVKIDNQLIPKEKYSEFLIPDNSEIEIIHLISGG